MALCVNPGLYFELLMVLPVGMFGLSNLNTSSSSSSISGTTQSSCCDDMLPFLRVGDGISNKYMLIIICHRHFLNAILL